MKTKQHVLILQHPQEPKQALSTAHLAHMALPESTLRVGLSWPNLSKALGRAENHQGWGVLYLGGKSDREKNLMGQDHGFNLRGFVVLDGTWSQAKTLWWRNPWLIKLQRLILTPSQPSIYAKLRREPRKECLSTIEAIAETLRLMGNPPEVPDGLSNLMKDLIKKVMER